MHGEGTGGAITQAGRATHSWARVCQLPLRTCHPPQRLTARGSSCEKEVAASLGHEDRTSGRAERQEGWGCGTARPQRQDPTRVLPDTRTTSWHPLRKVRRADTSRVVRRAVGEPGGFS